MAANQIKLNEITSPQELNLLVAFFDLTRFTQFAQNHSAGEIFEILAGYYEFVGEIIEDSGGTVVKFIGDAGLIVYPEARVDQGVLALKDLKDSGDAWLAAHQMPGQNIITAHFGAVVCGPVGTRSRKQFDVFGETVNIAATLKSNGLAITPQVFRRLNSSTRKLFKKHTPPVTYIPLTERHQD